jgi:peptidoglycan/xylan/chitin deacetylase (PgdA/CDA1 family)
MLNQLRHLFGTLRRKSLGPIGSFQSSEPIVALTFDDGPNPEFTPRLLDILHEHGARATFFMVGEAAARAPELVQRVASEGHVVGNHSWNHPRFPDISGSERRRQIRECERVLQPHGTRLFRAPFGSEDLATHLDVRRTGHRSVNWNVGFMDWGDRPSDWLANSILEVIRPGSIVLMHDGLYGYADPKYLDRRPTLEAVKMVLSRAAGRFQFVTLTEMFRRGRPCR